ncbi:hypothetical protein [Aequorivita sp. Q41]|uniref:hypothetical protein n=1 Tax=Aequorivita sp. Q41 TaxID=3153300 RepID=UPI0032422EE7
MKSLYTIVCLICLALPTLSYSQINVYDLIEDVKKERGDATDTGKDAANKKGMEDIMDGLVKSANTVSEQPVEVRCLALMHSHHMKLLISQGMVNQAGGSCKKAKEALEFQAMLVLSAGTQIYCPDEFNSDKVKYAILILEAMFEDYLSGKAYNQSLNEIFDSLEEVSEELGNPHAEAILLFGRIKENYNRINKPNYTAGIDSFLQNEVYQVTDTKWQELRVKVYDELIDYITYFHSPGFMADRAFQINSLVQSLACD